MRSMISFALATCALLAACSPDSSTGTTTIEHTLTWQQDPQSEIEDCHIFKLDNADPVEVDRLSVQFGQGSHHVHIYRADSPQPDDVYSCWSGIDWTVWHLVVGVQTQPMDWQLQPGLTVPFDPHQQMLVQVHWLNTTDEEMNGNIDLSFHTVEHSDAHLGVVFGINEQTAMQPGEHKVLHQWCALPDNTQLVALMGHYHGLGTNYAVDRRTQGGPPGPDIYTALDDDTFQFKLFDPLYDMGVGNGLDFECDFFNYRAWPIVWSADTTYGEHCNMSAYYFPATNISTMCIIPITEVTSITAATAAAVAPDTDVVYTIQLTGPALAGGADVQLSVSDPTALVVPAHLLIPEGQMTATFTAHAVRPSRVVVTALLGSTSQTTTTSIGGLVLSEVYVGAPGNTDGRQWVEIANLSDAAVDLSSYSLGAGKADYTATRLPLTMMLPPKGCVVVGGPQLTVAGQPPYDQSADFTPNLGVSDTTANGIALFDVTADQIAATTLPLDALVYGADNNVLIDSTGQLATVVAPAPALGTYYRRTVAQWATQAAPTPGICEVN